MNVLGRTIPVLLLCMLSVLACKTVSSDVVPGSAATTVIDPAFEFRPGLRVAVLPFTVLGSPDRTIDISEADRLCMELQEIGFTIVESLIFQDHELPLQGLIPEQDWLSVQRVVGIDYLLLGTINYAYNPGYSLVGKGYYAPSSASVRFVDINTGQVVVIATTAPVRGSLARELGESIRQHIFRD